MQEKVLEHIKSSDMKCSSNTQKQHDYEQVILDALRDVLELCKTMDLRKVMFTITMSCMPFFVDPYLLQNRYKRIKALSASSFRMKQW